MADNEPPKKSGSTNSDDSVEKPSPESQPADAYGIRAEVDQKLDSLFGALDNVDANDEKDAGGDASPEENTPETETDAEGKVERIRADMVGKLEDEEEAVVDWNDDAPQPGGGADAFIRKTVLPEKEPQAVADDEKNGPPLDVPPVMPDSDDHAKPTPVSASAPKAGSKTPSAPVAQDAPVTGRRQDRPPGGDPPKRPPQSAFDNHDRSQPVPPPAEPEPRKPLTSRIIVWGAVLIIITLTVRYFAGYDPEAFSPPTAETGQLFHKIAPPPPSAAVSAPAAQPLPVKPEAAAPQAPPPPKAPVPAAGVKAYVPRAYPYAIHMASYRSPEAAQVDLANYRRGFQAYLVRVDLGNKGIWYRLFLGHFPNATSALDAIGRYRLSGALVSRTRYACLSGAYPSATQADAASRLLAGKGFFPYTIATGGAYHVFVGAYHTAAAAKVLSKDLSASGFTNVLIER